MITISVYFLENENFSLKTFNILQSEIHVFCIPEEESLNVSTLPLFCFFNQFTLRYLLFWNFSGRRSKCQKSFSIPPGTVTSIYWSAHLKMTAEAFAERQPESCHKSDPLQFTIRFVWAPLSISEVKTPKPSSTGQTSAGGTSITPGFIPVFPVSQTRCVK